MQDRKASYKTPPATIRDSSTSQEARRKKALEEQKRRRAERFDSSRQLDFFADLNLGPSDDDEDIGREPVREGISQFATLLSESVEVSSVQIDPTSTLTEEEPVQDAPPTSFSSKKRGKSKRKGKARVPGAQQGQSSKPNGKWADKCMYAELLEMTEDTVMAGVGDITFDGIPADIESGWVAVTPVPMGKRCLAITHAPSGIAGVVPNTTLRSRVLGKSLMKSFPSPLPPHTVLDCILDENWRSNGILHILDVIKWKGQDIADCETPFRFWWRDTRMSELPTFPPPGALSQASLSNSSRPYQFQYPNTLLCVPYHLNLSISNMANVLVPLSRSERQISIDIPVQSKDIELETMEVEDPLSATRVELVRELTRVSSDGMLLYVSQATYEPGTSPLSLWIPIKVHGTDTGMETPSEGPMDVFERLIRQRLRLA